jgi:hypothetical protein
MPVRKSAIIPCFFFEGAWGETRAGAMFFCDVYNSKTENLNNKSEKENEKKKNFVITISRWMRKPSPILGLI